MAIISPPQTELANLRPPLNNGEERVLAALATLDDSWWIYVQPRLRMDQPDFVVVHERFGVCAIEVKDWAPGLYRQLVTGVIQVRTNEGWQSTREHPRLQAHRYRRTIVEHFFSSPDSGTDDWPVVRAALILPQYSTAAARDLFHRHHLYEQSEMQKGISVWGQDGLSGRSLLRLLTGYSNPKGMRVAATGLQRLKYHLREPEVVADQRRALEMSPAARNLATNPDGARIRRARGPAGSGKSVGLAARAAVLASQSKTVLVLCFNITLPHYLHDMAARHAATLKTNLKSVEFTHFHGFCSRAHEDGRALGLIQEVDQLSEHDALQDTNDVAMQQMVQGAISTYQFGSGTRYDAILVDEGQDFTADWWNFLRRSVLKPSGEMLLVADTTQDLYDRKAWTAEKSMRNCGFRGPWTELVGSYRLPPDLIPVVREYGSRYLNDGAYDPPTVPDDHPMRREASEPTSKRWRNVSSLERLSCGSPP